MYLTYNSPADQLLGFSSYVPERNIYSDCCLLARLNRVLRVTADVIRRTHLLSEGEQERAKAIRLFLLDPVAGAE